ncbi:MAG: hypothetical protein VB877_07745, partial [Pirellulaceae bacterium]
PFLRTVTCFSSDLSLLDRPPAEPRQFGFYLAAHDTTITDQKTGYFLLLVSTFTILSHYNPSHFLSMV